MKTDPAVLDFLNEVLTAEFTAINQYFIHAKLLDNWGIAGLAAKERAESIEEMVHAEQVIDRILYYEGTPNMQRLDPVRVGESPEEALRADFELEKEAIARYQRGVALCTEKGDYGTRDFCAARLMEEEQHADWLETQLDLIGRIGIQLYLASHITPPG
jgi:bacterioferritin